MSQANQHSIETLFRGRADRSALLDAEDEQTTLTASRKQPLFQDFTRHIPTETEIKTAEEIEYDELVRKFGEPIKRIKAEKKAEVKPAPYSHTSSIIDGLIGPPLDSLHLHDRDMSGIYDSECFEISEDEFMDRQADAVPYFSGGRMMTDKDVAKFEEGIGNYGEDDEMFEEKVGREMTEELLEYSGGRDNDKENLAPFNGVITLLPPRATSTSISSRKEDVRWPQTPNTQPEHPTRPRFAPVSSATLVVLEYISGRPPNSGGQPKSLSAVAKIDQSLEAPESSRKVQEGLRDFGILYQLVQMIRFLVAFFWIAFRAGFWLLLTLDSPLARPFITSTSSSYRLSTLLCPQRGGQHRRAENVPHFKTLMFDAHSKRRSLVLDDEVECAWRWKQNTSVGYHNKIVHQDSVHAAIIPGQPNYGLRLSDGSFHQQFVRARQLDWAGKVFRYNDIKEDETQQVKEYARLSQYSKSFPTIAEGRARNQKINDRALKMLQAEIDRARQEFTMAIGTIFKLLFTHGDGIRPREQALEEVMSQQEAQKPTTQHVAMDVVDGLAGHQNSMEKRLKEVLLAHLKSAALSAAFYLKIHIRGAIHWGLTNALVEPESEQLHHASDAPVTPNPRRAVASPDRNDDTLLAKQLQDTITDAATEGNCGKRRDPAYATTRTHSQAEISPDGPRGTFMATSKW
ncbi:MAG: hypothetical protein Q9226_006812 [Calogaya cf. arnoldii]